MSGRAEPAPAPIETRLGPARIWCTGRALGNVGEHVGDDEARVRRNRAALAELVGVDARRLVWIRQVHGADVHVASVPESEPAVADAVLTATRGLAVAVVTADCAPIVIACDDAVGVVHAGHRGLSAGVVEAAIARLQEIGRGEVRALLGPCIRAGCYEFGPDDLAAFVARFGPEAEARTRSGMPALDLPAAVAVVLRRAGVETLQDTQLCTADSDAWFSYRRDGATGRQATVALLP